MSFNECEGTACRPSVASQLQEEAQRIAMKAQEVAKETDAKLISVSRSEPDHGLLDSVAEEWPPLFAALRAELWKIDDALGCIRQSLNRVEL